MDLSGYHSVNYHLLLLVFQMFIGLTEMKQMFKALNEMIIPFLSESHLRNNLTITSTALALNLTSINNVMAMTSVSPLRRLIGVQVNKLTRLYILI